MEYNLSPQPSRYGRVVNHTRGKSMMNVNRYNNLNRSQADMQLEPNRDVEEDWMNPFKIEAPGMYKKMSMETNMHQMAASYRVKKTFPKMFSK